MANTMEGVKKKRVLIVGAGAAGTLSAAIVSFLATGDTNLTTRHVLRAATCAASRKIRCYSRRRRQLLRWTSLLDPH